MDGFRLTELLGEKLHLEFPPVGLAFADGCPTGAFSLVKKEPPSFCTLWRWGEEHVFYASATQHLGCPIGAMVAGFVSPEERLSELATALQEMCEHGQGDPTEEIATTARFTHQSVGIVYGPLWKFSLEPQIVLMWTTLPQIGVLQEMVGRIMWRDNPQGALFTRPACSVLAIAAAHGKVAMSLGCIGMRLNTGMAPQYVLAALPRPKLDELEEGLCTKTDVDERLQFYQERLRSSVAQGS